MSYPQQRLTRTRQSQTIRDLVSEVTLRAEDLMYPIFVVHGSNIKQPIEALQGQFQWSIDQLSRLIETLQTKGIRSVMLFGVPAHKDQFASENYDSNGIVQQAITLFKQQAPEILVAADICLCGYTPHGHCGVLNHSGDIDEYATLDVLAKTAISYAKAGADMVAPSGMTDGMVQAIRQGLDHAGWQQTMIMSYAIKYASNSYGPFRYASQTELKGDRKAYQMDYRNQKEAMLEAQLDQQEGADILMIKPAMNYLDIITRLSDQSSLPLAAYHVSGEYAMITAAAERGWIEKIPMLIESLTAIKRSGARIILTYGALDVIDAL